MRARPRNLVASGIGCADGEIAAAKPGRGILERHQAPARRPKDDQRHQQRRREEHERAGQRQQPAHLPGESRHRGRRHDDHAAQRAAHLHRRRHHRAGRSSAGGILGRRAAWTPSIVSAELLHVLGQGARWCCRRRRRQAHEVDALTIAVSRRGASLRHRPGVSPGARGRGPSRWPRRAGAAAAAP